MSRRGRPPTSARRAKSIAARLVESRYSSITRRTSASSITTLVLYMSTHYTSSGILVPVNVGDLMRDARTTAKLSQAALADRAKTSQPAIARYEAGTASPSLGTLERILAACGRSLVLSAPQQLRRRRQSSSGRRLALIRQLRTRLRAAAQRHGVRDLRVFGSVARGDDTADSDVDFLVNLDPGRTLVDLIGFEQEAQDILGVGVDVATPRMMKERVRARAIREARPVLSGATASASTTSRRRLGRSARTTRTAAPTRR
jgi:predicted nucleotidyltransferase/ribosome-binding protein aMBF1 (putative translation factor)